MKTSDSNWQRMLLSSIEVGIIVLDENYQVEALNQFVQNHGDLDVKTVIGKSFFDTFDYIEKEWFERKCKPAFSMNIPVFIIWEQHPHLFQFAAGRPVTSESELMYQNITIFPIQESDGTTKVCILIYDMTDNAISKKRTETLYQELQEISRIDGLTKLYNRRYWQEVFDREFKLAKRKTKVMSVVILDIDLFKKVNDTYGHQVGDEVIQALGKILKFVTRETDVCGRYGGEEFVILLPDTNKDNAKIVTERVRTTVDKLALNTSGGTISFTVSAGVAEFSSSYESPANWLNEADKALYVAKEQGRNRVILAGGK